MTTPPLAIHVLGLGNLGRLYAHALATLPSPPSITLLLHRPSLLTEWKTAGSKISITTNNILSTSSNYSVELNSSPSTTPIENLIITTKTLHTIQALSSIKHRLNQNSTILFTQNGMGTIDEVTTSIFPDASTRPRYLAAVTSHGVYTLGPFSSVHAGMANITIGSVSPTPTPTHPLINLIVSAPSLNATSVTPQELIRLQLQKLALNAIINPLTSIFNVRNGQLLVRPEVHELAVKLLGETSEVLLSLPELSSDREAKLLFTVENLDEILLQVAEKTAQNMSSMLQDFRAGRQTEIDYINGYIVKRGKELGIDVKLNEKVVSMVKEKKVIRTEEIGEHFNL